MSDERCPKCKDIFKSESVKIKGTIGYEGIEVLIFDCPCCGQEIDNFQCDGVEEYEYYERRNN